MTSHESHPLSEPQPRLLEEMTPNEQAVDWIAHASSFVGYGLDHQIATPKTRAIVEEKNAAFKARYRKEFPITTMAHKMQTEDKLMDEAIRPLYNVGPNVIGKNLLLANMAREGEASISDGYPTPIVHLLSMLRTQTGNDRRNVDVNGHTESWAVDTFIRH